MKALTVITPFADYKRGDQITDADKIGEILLGHNAHHVVQITLVDRRPAEGAEAVSPAPSAVPPAPPSAK